MEEIVSEGDKNAPEVAGTQPTGTIEKSKRDGGGSGGKLSREPLTINAFSSTKDLNMSKKQQILQVLPYPHLVPDPELLDSSGGCQSFTLPPRLAIPVGVAQVVVGCSMVLCGSFALRYQSYLFYYGSGLWAGLLAGIAGILAVMGSKSDLKKPTWLCGGRKWQIRIFLAAVLMALIAAILTAVFSTSGLVRDTQYDYSQFVKEMTQYEKMYEKRKSSGIIITAILLLLALLQILLCFCSLGITLRVLCINSYGNFLLQDSSDGSDVTKKEITGQEYQAKTDRLMCWLGYQKRQYFPWQIKRTPSSYHPPPPPSKVAPTRNIMRMESRVYPQTRMIAVRSPPQIIPIQQQYAPSLPLVFPTPIPLSSPRSYIIPQSLPPLFPFTSPVMMPVVPFPVRRPRSLGPPSVAASSLKRYRVIGHSEHSLPDIIRRQEYREQQERKAREARETSDEITEEEVEKTYTGLDREIAEKFISNTMSNH